jgi:hypothetical protein
MIAAGRSAFAAPSDMAAPSAAQSPILAQHESPLTLQLPLISDRASALYADAMEMPKFDDDQWHLQLAFPLWIPAISGNLTVRGRTLQPDQDTSDSFDVIENHINFAFVGHFEARKNRWNYIADIMYIDLRGEGQLGRGNEASLKGFIGELSAAYTVIAPEKTGFGAFRLDVLGGVRVSSVRLGVDFDNLNSTANETVYDPIVGLRLEFGLLDWLSIRARGDVGGFGISAWDTSDNQYNVEAALDFKISQSFEVLLGYRWQHYKFIRDPGIAEFNADISGPFVTLQFNF